LIDRTLFVPVFGLGAPEQRYLNLLQAKLPEHYRVVPVYSRYSQLYNGGAHCILAFIREPHARPMMTESEETRPGKAAPQPAETQIPAIRFTDEIR
jgi:hypothetical protein